MRKQLVPIAAVTFVVAAAVLLSLTSPLGGDYEVPGCRGPDACDDAGWAIRALAHGHVGEFFALQPTMGSVSLVLRAPFAWLGRFGDDSSLTLYRLGVFACLLVAGLIGVWVASVALRRGAPRAAVALLVVGWVVNPVTFRALFWGHPEEPFGAALTVGSVVAASAGLAGPAGVLLGLAIATKQWALLALPAVLLAAPRVARARSAVVALVVAVACTLPMLAGNPTRFFDAGERVVSDSAFATPTNIWWNATIPDPLSPAGSGARVAPDWVDHASHPLLLAVILVLTGLWWRRRLDPFALLALIFLARCVLDPYAFSYHHAPFLLALLAYEVVSLRRVPVAAAVASAALATLIWWHPLVTHPDVMNVVYLAAAALGAGWIARSAVRHPAFVS